MIQIQESTMVGEGWRQK